ncbi:MAG: hypothetical protein JRG91_13650 [Deltaproteobacteria bacterium]|nr:hypothetical protein [Deltaproteobacteria bacterium]
MSDRQETPGTADGKRPYEPPRLETVKVNLEEVALTACKSFGGGGPGASCMMGCVVGGS